MTKETVEFKMVSPHFCKLNINTVDGKTILDIYRGGQFIKTINIDATGERIA